MVIASTAECSLTMVVRRTFLQIEEDSHDDWFDNGSRPRSFSDPGLQDQESFVKSFDDETESVQTTAAESSKERSPRWADVDVENASAISFHDTVTQCSDADIPGALSMSAATQVPLGPAPPGVLSMSAAAQWPLGSAPPGIWSPVTAEPVSRDFGAPRTSLILKNIPVGCTRIELLGFLDSHGFHGQYDFLYMPTNFRTWKGCGYAFVDMVSHSMAELMMQTLHGFEGWCAEGTDVLEISFSEIQGVEAHVKLYRNSPVMHQNVPDEYKPVLFMAGERLPFPAPQCKIKAPPALTKHLIG